MHAGGTPGSLSLAKWITYIINPLILPPILLSIVCAKLTLTGAQTATIITLSIIFFALIPFVIILRVAETHGGVSIELRQKELRLAPYLVSIASDFVVLALVHTLARPVPKLITSLLLCYALNAVILFLINTRFKISLHMASITGFVSMTLFILLEKEAILAGGTTQLVLAIILGVLATPIVVWARLHLRAHSRPEVIAGTVFGLTVPYALLYFLERII